MTQTSPQPIENIGRIRGSTAQIMIQLYKRSQDLPEDIQPNVLNKVTAIDVRAAQTLDRLSSAPNRLEYTDGAIRTSLAQMVTPADPKEVISKETKDLHARYSADFAGVQAKVGTILAERDAMLRQYQELIQKQNQALRQLIHKFLDGEITQDDLIARVKTTGESFKEFSTRVNRLVQDQTNLQRDLDNLHYKIYLDIPSNKKANVPPPEAAIPRGPGLV